MKRLQAAAGLSVTLACLALASPASAAGKYDGSKPMLCAVSAVSECTANGKCEPSAPQVGNNLPNFSSYLDRILDELFIDRMEGNEEIFARVMTDKDFRATAHDHLAQEIFRRARGATN